MDKLINLFLQTEQLTNLDLEEIKSQFIPVNYHPKDYFLEANKLSKKIGFIEKGIFRIFSIDSEGIEQTRYFVLPEQFLVELNSFTSDYSK